MRGEGRGQRQNDATCHGCFLREATVRCDECFGKELFCRECCVVRHQRLPLHRIKVCRLSLYLITFSLPSGVERCILQADVVADIGLRVQLGEDHEPGTYCVFGRDIHKDFVVLHTNGIHLVNVDFCGCSPLPGMPKVDVYKQLLRVDWYPATVLEPQSCATFELMKLFHLLSLEGKISAYHFYKTLHHRTENSGIEYVHVSISLSKSSFNIQLVTLGSLSSFRRNGSQMEARANAQKSRARI